MTRVPVESFLDNNQNIPLIDVRSPREFKKGHIVSAKNIPLFTDEERHEIGIIYKQLGRIKAISRGLEFVGQRMQELVDKAIAIAPDQNSRKVYCWRGGMRSEKTAWLFELGGLKCNVLAGGYKAYRNKQITDFSNIDNLFVLHGSTGCGKTEILSKLTELGEQVIDLEKLANHRGSAFGYLGKGNQPTSQQFQNDIHSVLTKFNLKNRIWVEAESKRIGSCSLPDALWLKMKDATTVEIKVESEERIQRIIKEYGFFPKEMLIESIRCISERLGNKRLKKALTLLENNDLESTVSILLDYYDRSYEFTRKKFREDSFLTINTTTGDAETNAKELLQKIEKHR